MTPWVLPALVFAVLDVVRVFAVRGSLRRVQAATWEVSVFPLVVMANLAGISRDPSSLNITLRTVLVAWYGVLAWQARQESKFPGWWDRLRAKVDLARPTAAPDGA